MRYIYAVFFVFALSFVAFAGEIEDRVISPSVTVRIGDKIAGSGTIFIVGNKGYVITAGHVVDSQKVIKEVEEIKDGYVEVKKKIFWEPVSVLQDVYDKKKKIGEVIFNAKVVAFDIDEDNGGEDVSVLEVLNPKSLGLGARWGDSDDLNLGDDVLHVGSPYGFPGCLLKGSVMKMDFSLLRTSWTLVDMPTKGGCSGGGVFAKINNNYHFVGMVTRGDGAGLTLVKPSSIIKKILEKNKMRDIVDAK